MSAPLKNPWKWGALTLAVLIFGLSLVSISGMHLEEDILALLPSDPEILRYKRLLEQFNPMNAMLLEISPIDTLYSEEQWLGKADSLGQSMTQSGHFKKILYKYDFSAWTTAVERMRAHREVLTSSEALSIIISRTAYDSILHSLQQWKRLLMETPAPFLLQQFQTDPLALDALLLENLTGFSSSNAITMSQGRMMSHDLNHALMIAYPHMKATDSRRSAELIAFMDSVQLQFPDLTIAYVSGHRFSLENSRRIQRDIQLTLTLSITAILLLSFFVFSRPWLVTLTLLPGLFGTTLALGILRWLYPAVSAIAIGSGALLIGITVDYAIHLLFHVESNRSLSPVYHRNRIRKPLLLSAATTGAAFLTLTLSSLPGYRQLGLFAALGIAGSIGFVLLVMPILLKFQAGKPARKPRIAVADLLAELFAWMARRRTFMLFLSILLTLLLIPGLFRLSLDGDLQNLNAVNDEISQDWQRIQFHFGEAINRVSVAVTANDRESALRRNEAVLDILQELRSTGDVTQINSVSRLLPSERLQQQRIVSWLEVFTPAFHDSLSARFSRAAAVIRLKPEFFNPFLETLKKEAVLLDNASFSEGVIGDILGNQTAYSEKSVSLLTTVSTKTSESFEHLISKLKPLDNITIYSGSRFINQVGTLILKELRRIGLFALLTVSLILLILTRRIPHLLRLLLPLLLGLLWTFGIMGWLSIRINLINAMVVVFIFGLVIDYCIFLYHAYTSPNSGKSLQERSAAAIAVSALTTCCGMGAMIFAKHPALHALGVSALIGITTGVVSVFILIPLVFTRSKKATDQSA